jgi:hypothetical protein
VNLNLGKAGNAVPGVPKHSDVIHVQNLMIGGGPAGLAPLIAASGSPLLAQILARGLVVVERGDAIGAGRIGTYAVKSDSTAETLLSCIYENPNPAFARLRAHPAVLAVAAYQGGAVPLPLVGALMAVIGAMLGEQMAAVPGCAVLVGHDALQTRQRADGQWRTTLRRRTDGARQEIESRLVVLATGGHQPASLVAHYHQAGMPLLPRYESKMVASGDALTSAGLAGIAQRLAGRRAKKIVIIGSSSSALACANAMLALKDGSRLAVDEVIVLHRRPLRIFYPSAQAALEDGYSEFGPEDICPLSGFVFRFAGFRLESRELVLAARRIGGRRADARLSLYRLNGSFDRHVQTMLEEADIIIPALGYRPRALPVVSVAGQPITLFAQGPGARALVDDRCRVLDGRGAPIAGLFGIGLAAGFLSPDGSGGEPSFSGQTNGLWQWQNEVGMMIARRLAGEGES